VLSYAPRPMIMSVVVDSRVIKGLAGLDPGAPRQKSIRYFSLLYPTTLLPCLEAARC
jgi:hypothetical protein